VCYALAEQGGTDYVVWRLDLGDCEIGYISWASRREGGFRDEDLAVLEALNPPFALRLELEAANYTMRSLLDVYLGQNAAARVLAGSFKRGAGESIRAVIWFCDMRGFTSLADRMPAADVVETLDRFFEAVAGPIASYGGEILKFIGDAALAIFPVEHHRTQEVCENAIAAATAAVSLVDELNETRAPEAPIGFGIALHLGDVMYGNIGAQNRLDFTVIGAAVNEVCRVEALSKSLDAPLLMTRVFVDAWGGRSVSAGTHTLRGVAEPQELFTLPRDET
jgi:adenylate cyclase